MYISRRWLEDYINLASISDDELSELLISLGHEVESFRKISSLDNKLSVGKIRGRRRNSFVFIFSKKNKHEKLKKESCLRLFKISKKQKFIKR